MKMLPEVRRELAPVLAEFRRQDVDVVFVTLCCNRVFAGVAPPKRCRTCDTPPVVHTLKTDGSDFPVG